MIEPIQTRTLSDSRYHLEFMAHYKDAVINGIQPVILRDLTGGFSNDRPPMDLVEQARSQWVGKTKKDFEQTSSGWPTPVLAPKDSLAITIIKLLAERQDEVYSAEIKTRSDLSWSFEITTKAKEDI